jgi:hypothetical protein
VFSIGIVLALGMVGELSLFNRLACALALFALAIVGIYRLKRLQDSYALDIGGTGQIRLTALAVSAKQGNHSNIHPLWRGMLVTLLPDSTLWSRFMVLRLQDDGGRIHVLPIWADSVSSESFRALAVACRWIAAHRFAE